MITKLTPYLYFEGNAEEAMTFYKTVFDCQDSDIVRYKDMKSDVEVPKEMEDKVMHGTLKHASFQLYLTDNLEEPRGAMGKKTSLLIEFDSEEEIRRVFDALKEGGAVTTDLHEAFWGDLYGAVTDRYGLHWELDHQIVRP